MRFPFWQGDGVRRERHIIGRRLDSAAAPWTGEIPEGHGEAGFQAAGMVFAAESCWEATASAGDGTLTFVTQAVFVPATEG